MKSYLQGMITGGVMVFASIVLMGQSNSSFQSMVKDYNHIFDIMWKETLAFRSKFNRKKRIKAKFKF